MKYTFNSSKELTIDYIKKFIEIDEKERVRKARLYDYYKGKHDITKRVYDDPSKPNNKVVNPYPKYITTLMTGYFMGEPVAYSSQNETFLDKLQIVLDYNDESQVNKELAKNQSIFGVGAEVVYNDREGNVLFRSVNPEGMIAIYDTSIEQNLIYAIRYWDEVDILEHGKKIRYVEVYSDRYIRRYTAENSAYSLVEEQKHLFGDVPVVFYWNNEEGIGDFEPVMSEIDAYDSFESDSVNEADYFADSYLMLNGMQGTEPEDIRNMKENRVMLMPEGSSAGWLNKSINDTWIENEKKRLDQDIHKFSFCPAMTDENFAANASGIAMKYKLMGLENCVSVKESEFEKSLRRRLELIYGHMGKIDVNWEVDDVNIIFTRNIPEDLGNAVDTVNKLSGVLSDETRLQLLPLNIDVKAEIEKVNEEKLANYSIFADDLTGAGDGEA